jgi:SAM-dependent methyltransferase
MKGLKSFLYKVILKPILMLSKLGRTSIKGSADSGLNFDHMYRNKPKGITSFGRLTDRILLNLPSVRATRHRKDVIIKLLRNEIENNIILNKKTRIVDIASGPARYISELLDEVDQDKIEVLCIDKDKRSLNYGKILAGEKPVRFTKADIMKMEPLKKLAKKVSWIPNIIIASGLLEYQEDETVKRIISESFDNIQRDGLSVFISQVSNPSRELIEELGKTSTGEKWILNYRGPELFRKWMLDSGFRSVLIEVDEWGMYEFCMGRKY